MESDLKWVIRHQTAKNTFLSLIKINENNERIYIWTRDRTKLMCFYSKINATRMAGRIPSAGEVVLKNKAWKELGDVKEKGNLSGQVSDGDGLGGGKDEKTDFTENHHEDTDGKRGEGVSPGI